MLSTYSILRSCFESTISVKIVKLYFHDFTILIEIEFKTQFQFMWYYVYGECVTIVTLW